jgi:hypothetical protein
MCIYFFKKSQEGFKSVYPKTLYIRIETAGEYASCYSLREHYFRLP